MKEKFEKSLKLSNRLNSKEDFEFSLKLHKKVTSFFDDDTLAISSLFIFVDENDYEIVEREFGKEVLEVVKNFKLFSKVRFLEEKKRLYFLRDELIRFSEDLRSLFLRIFYYSIHLESHDDLNSAKEALYLYAPIARRLGISKIYSELEDKAFKILFPDDYEYLYELVERRRNEFERKLDELKEDVKRLLNEKFSKVKIEGRVKRLFSIFRKMKRKNIMLDEIFDLLALRVIVEKVEDCYQVLGLIHSRWVPIEGRFRDWISFPKPNGYRAIQTTVLTEKGDKFEIQIKTEDMHREAEYGIAAHWGYKEGISSKRKMFWILRLREFLETYSYTKTSKELFEQLKKEIKRDYINVLTPKGDIIKLPDSATPIDFAYAIHTEVGNHLQMAKVNGKLVPLRTKLKSGDIVEVVTSKKAQPSLDWLKFVATSKARSKIRERIRKIRKEELLEEGRKKLISYLKEFSKKYGVEVEFNTIKENIRALGFDSFDSLLLSIGEGSYHFGMGSLRKLIPELKNLIKKKRKKKKEKEKDFIVIEGERDLEYELAKCCNPKPSDNIVAYITLSRGIKIHKKDCKNLLKESVSQERIKRAEWKTI